MHALVVAHPNPQSRTDAVAMRVARGIKSSDAHHSVEMADLSAERFDPRFTEADVALSLGQGETPPEIAAEHARIARANALVLVFPVYWWSFPALLKGWIDRVFNQGWAYADLDGILVKKLQHLQIHMIALGASQRETYARHGDLAAMKTQIEHGIFGYCGAQVVTFELLLAADPGFPAAHLATAEAIGRRILAQPSGADGAKHGPGARWHRRLIQPRTRSPPIPVRRNSPRRHANRHLPTR